MRILMLTQFYAPIIGGEERHVENLSRALVARGHEVAVATLRHAGQPEFEVEHGVRLYRVRGSMQRLGMLFSEKGRQFTPPFPDPEVLGALHRIIREEKPEIVHAHNWLIRSFTPLKNWSKARLVMTLHDYSLVCVQRRMMQRGTPCSGPGLAKCLGCAGEFYGVAKGWPTVLANSFWSGRERQAVDLFLPVSQATADGNQLDAYHVPYKVMPNFMPDHVDIRDDDHDPLLSQLPQDGFLLFVGDITSDKGIEVLLQAYAELHTHLPLVLIGRPLLPNLNKKLPPNVFLLGAWPHDAVMGAWKRCTLGLIPSIVAETFGIVALEAMSMGKPVIATRNGGLIDVVEDGKTGLLIAPGDACALREAMQTLLDNQEQRAYMGNQAKQHTVKFRAEVVIADFEQLYQELLGGAVQNVVYAQTLHGR